MHSFVIEAEPARALRSLAVAFQILLAVVGKHVVLSWHKKRLPAFGRFQDLIEGVEFTRLRKMTQVSRMNQKVRRMIERVDFVNRFL